MYKTVKIYKEDAEITFAKRDTDFGLQIFLRGHVTNRPIALEAVMAIRNLTLTRQNIYLENY